jgi:hypothetical protein
MREMQYGVNGRKDSAKRLHVQVVFGSSSRASRESIDKGRRPCRKSSSWIGGVLLTHTRPHKCVWIGE